MFFRPCVLKITINLINKNGFTNAFMVKNILFTKHYNTLIEKTLVV